MDTANQFFIFCVCLLSGLAFGFFFDGVACVGGVLCRLFPRRGRGIVKGVFEVVAILFCAVAFVWLSSALYFPEIRIYMYVGIVLGVCLYLKSWRRILDFVKKVCYNVFIIKFFQPLRNRLRQRIIKSRAKKEEKKQRKKLAKENKKREKRKLRVKEVKQK